MASTDLSILIVNWNTKDYLKGCISSVYDSIKGISFEIIVVDNASTDGSVEMLKKNFPEVNLIENKDNAGFAKGNNQAYAVSKGRKICVLNPDTIVYKDTFEKMAAYLGENNRVGAVSCKFLNSDGSFQREFFRRFPSLYTVILRYTHTGRFLNNRLFHGRALDSFFYAEKTFEQTEKIDQPGATCLLMRRSLIEKIGLFDEQFPIFFNDVDLCRRIWKEGFEIHVIPDASITHYGGGNTKLLTEPERFGLVVSGVFNYFRKHQGVLSAYLVYFIMRADLWIYKLYQGSSIQEEKPDKIVMKRLSGPSISDYEVWMKHFVITEKKRNHAISEINLFSYKPLISIVTPVYNIDEVWIGKCIDSVLKQTYQNWELCIVDDASTRPGLREFLQQYADKDSRIKVKYLSENLHISGATNEAIDMSSGEFIAFLDHDDELHDNALYEVVNLLQSSRDADVIYTDSDIIDTSGRRCNPKFKPDWSPELLLSYMYISHLRVCRADLVKRMGGLRRGYEGSQDHDLMLRLSEVTSRIYHVPKILYHARSLPESVASSGAAKPYSFTAGVKAVQDAVDRRGIQAKVDRPEFAVKGSLGIYRLNFTGVHKDRVAIIIPTRDRLDLLKNCVSSIETKTTYPNYEIIIANDNSKEDATLIYFKSIKHKVINIDGGGVFNFSHIVNQAIRQLDREIEYIMLLNNDVELITGSWIEEMLGIMQCQEIGAVGAKLLYKDDTIQHAGVILGLHEGLPGHAFKTLSNTSTGYLFYPSVVRDYSAVTAACMLTRRSYFDEVGGFDEVNFGEAYNDVDYCLKLRERGYRVVYTPYAQLYHYEGSSRGRRVPVEDEYHFRQKWGYIEMDPYYNPNLSGRAFEVNKQICEILPVSKKINILFITNNLNCEGAPLSLLSIARGLDKSQYNIIILSTQDGILRDSYKEEGIEVIIKEMNIFNIGGSDLKSEIRTLAEMIINLEINIIFCNTLNSFYGHYIAQSVGIPSVWCIRESMDAAEYFTKYCENKELAKMAVESFLIPTHIIFVSRATANLFGDLSHSRFRVIYNGIDINHIEKYKITHSKAQVRKDYGVQGITKVITIVGTTIPRKGQHIFILAALELLKKHDNLMFFIVGGRKWEYLEELEKMIADSGAGKYIKIIPETPEVFPYYCITDIFVCASYEESFPRVILEAMAFQLPIVSTNVFGIAEQIDNGQSGLLVPPGDHKLLSDRIGLLLDDEVYANELASNAYYRVISRFDYKNMIKSYESCLIESLFSAPDTINV